MLRMGATVTGKCAPGEHRWFVAEFVYAAWTECDVCGMRPHDEDEFDRENEAVSA